MASDLKPVRDAASVVLVRRGPRGLETFWVQRGQELAFAGGFYAFAGGRVDAADAALPVRGAKDLGPAEAALISAAARELFEETGVLVARGALTSGLRGEGPAADQRREELARAPREERDRTRSRLVARPAARTPGGAPASPGTAALFGGFLAQHGLALDARDFLPAGRWVTPPMLPVRFDARFYLVALPEGEEALVWPGELASGEWILPRDALARWEKGTVLLHPPAWHTLRCLALPQAQEDARLVLPLLQDPSRAPWNLPVSAHVVERMEFQRGLITVPLRTPTLPPATHTNCLLLGDDQLWIVDPGSPWPEEQALLERQLQLLAAEGRRPVGILLTHFHVDHVAGAPALARKLGLPVVAHEATRARLAGEVQVDRLLDEGERLEVGPRGWRALHLPGHTRGHLCLIEDGTGAVVAGDLLSGLSTVVIDPPEGDMGDYCESLRRLSALSPGAIFPAHGPVIAAGLARIEQTLAHRLEREEKVVRALAAAHQPSLPAELVPAAYPEVGPELQPLAERSLLAHLLKLVKDGRAHESAGRYSTA